jgi:uncharacterized protein YfaS (alpha-2-macroglobulin family)
MMIEGYQVTKEFYSPQYDTEKSFKMTAPDLRTTLYWNPHVKTDENGLAKVSFYNHDRITRIKIRAEGFAEKNIPLSGKFEYLIDEDTF